MNELALSTAFLINNQANVDGKEIIRQGLELGFSAFELNIETTKKMIDEIKKDVSDGKIGIVSLHNFCPKLEYLPPGKDLLSAYQFSSLDEGERKIAIELTKKTINYVTELNAQAVIIHAGEVEIELNEGELFSQFARMVRFTPPLRARAGFTPRPELGTKAHHPEENRKEKIDWNYLDKVKKEREEKKKIYLENSLKAVEEIVNYAGKKGIKVGLENRFFYHEIPNFEEIGLFLKNFGSGLGYWHDTGHAGISVKLGLVGSHEDYLKEYSSQMIGIHLHDVRGFKDHLAPGTGEIDFTILSKYINSTIIRAIEAHRRSTVEEVKESINYLKKVGMT